MAVVLSALFVLCPLAAYAAGEETDAVPLPIIMYHEVKPDKSGKDAIQPWELESDLRWLAENGYTTVVMADVIAYVRDGTPLPEKPIVLSFDDGYYNNYVYVLPLLRQYAALHRLFAARAQHGRFHRVPSESIDYAHVTWDQLNEMLDTGLVEVQNHSYDLHAYTSERHGCLPNAGSRRRSMPRFCARISSGCKTSSPLTRAAHRTPLPTPTENTATGRIRSCATWDFRRRCRATGASTTSRATPRACIGCGASAARTGQPLSAALERAYKAAG